MSLARHLADPPVDATALAIVDGEHYPPVVVDALGELVEAGWRIERVALVGGSEKLRGHADYLGLPIERGASPHDTVVRALDAHPHLRWVVDLSDEPALVLDERLRVVGAAAARDVGYAGADMLVVPPERTTVSVPSLSVVGTGKRIGKTSVAGHVATLARDAVGDVVVVAMGRGGPSQPVVVEADTVTLEQLVELSRAGMHAASDYLEDALLTGVSTIGCRRAGGGIVGAAVISNVDQAVQIVERRSPALAIYEGSGSCLPPVREHRRLLVGGARRPEDLLGPLGRARAATAHLVLVTGPREEALQLASRVELLVPRTRALGVELVAVPAADVTGRRVAVFTTAPESAAAALMSRFSGLGAELVVLSHDLARREALREQIELATGRGADAFVVEIKAAAVDVVAEAAIAHGIELVPLANVPSAWEPDIEIDEVLTQLIGDTIATAASDGSAGRVARS